MQDNETEMYSTHNEAKFVVAEQFVRNFKIKFYRHMNVVSKNVCINKIDGIVDRYNKAYQKTIKKMKLLM